MAGKVRTIYSQYILSAVTKDILFRKDCLNDENFLKHPWIGRYKQKVINYRENYISKQINLNVALRSNRLAIWAILL